VAGHDGLLNSENLTLDGTEYDRHHCEADADTELLLILSLSAVLMRAAQMASLTRARARGATITWTCTVARRQPNAISALTASVLPPFLPLSASGFTELLLLLLTLMCFGFSLRLLHCVDRGTSSRRYDLSGQHYWRIFSGRQRWRW
jgi:hypothetical protein